jgi:Uma2 family endonuclease
MSSLGNNANADLPDVNDRLVTPESGYEMDDGKLVRVPPSDPPHAFCHADLSRLLGAHVAGEYRVAIDMLTRTSKIDDIAPDASIVHKQPDPATGRRRLEELAFEIASTQSLGDAGKKAAKLVNRGVRRVFAIDVERARVFEWSRELGTWSILDPRASIEDQTLVIPLPIEALVSSAKVDDAVAKALIARRHPVVEELRRDARSEGQIEGRSEGWSEGRSEGRIEAVLAVLASREFAVTATEREQILAERDPARIDVWIARVGTCASVAELLDTE